MVLILGQDQTLVPELSSKQIWDHLHLFKLVCLEEDAKLGVTEAEKSLCDKNWSMFVQRWQRRNKLCEKKIDSFLWQRWSHFCFKSQLFRGDRDSNIFSDKLRPANYNRANTSWRNCYPSNISFINGNPRCMFAGQRYIWDGNASTKMLLPACHSLSLDLLSCCASTILSLCFSHTTLCTSPSSVLF